MAEDVDYLAVAGMTDGMVGAELANIVEVAAINMMRDRRTEVMLLQLEWNFLFCLGCGFGSLVKSIVQTIMNKDYVMNHLF